MVKTVKRSYFGAFVVVAAMALLCMLAGRGGAAAGDTTRVNVASDGTQANGESYYTPSINADGRFVAFSSGATNLVPNDTNGVQDVFVRDRQDGTTERVSVDSSGNQANRSSFSGPSISADGRFVAFVSEASNLVPGDTTFRDVFVRDRQTGTTERVSADMPSGVDPNGSPPSISADGRFVAFESFASEGVSSDTNALRDIFVYDRVTKTTERVSVDNSERQANGNSLNASISVDGRFVAFLSTATDLVAGDTNSFTDVFVHERDPGSTQPPDSIDPITTRTLSPQPNAAGWNNSDVTVTLNATDTGGSGLKEINYSVNGGASTTVQQSSVQVPVTREGTTTISYHSTDNAGNVEPEQTLTVKIDKSAPRVSTATPTGKGVTRSTNAVATFSEKANPTTITNSTFKLFKCSSTTSTDCATRITNVAITKSTDGLSATLNPFGSSTTQLAKNTKYKVVLTAGVTDEAGNHLDQNATTSGNQNKVWYFTTGLT